MARELMRKSTYGQFDLRRKMTNKRFASISYLHIREIRIPIRTTQYTSCVSLRFSSRCQND